MELAVPKVIREKDFSLPRGNSGNIFGFKISIAIISLTFVLLFIGGVQFQNAHFAYGQFFENSDAKSNITNSSNFSLNSTT
jgi:hypothetical protein